MPNVPLLSHTQMRRLELLLPRALGTPRIYNFHALSDNVYAIHNGLQWKAGAIFGPERR